MLGVAPRPLFNGVLGRVMSTGLQYNGRMATLLSWGVTLIRSISISLVMLAVLAVMTGNAVAETLVERGSYLVNTILACGNCHTPKNATGAAIAEKELAGGLSFTTPAFSVTAANITPDR